MLLRTDREARSVALDQESGELLAIDFGEDRIQVREARVGDPHLFAVQDVVLAIGRQDRARSQAHGIGAGRRLGERIGAHPLTRHQLRQILLLLLRGAVPDDRQHADADMRAERGCEAAQHRESFPNDGRSHLIHRQSAVFFRRICSHQAQLARLGEQRACHLVILRLDRICCWQNLLLRESGGRLCDLPLFIIEVLGREDLLRGALFQQEAAARGCFDVSGV